MRRFVLSTVLVLMPLYGAFAQASPVFKPLDPSLQVRPLPRTETHAPGAAAPIADSSATLPKRAVARDGEIIDSVGGGAIPALPLELTTENGISYLSGGIGDEEKEQLKSQEAGFNLRLLMTGMGGEYASNIRFALKDASGKELVTISDAGPYVYLQVPAGTYTVSAANGSTKSVTVKVPASGAVKQQIRL